MFPASRDALLMKTRRHFFQNCGIGVGKIALASLLADSALPTLGAHEEIRSPFQVRPTHFPATAKRVIYLFMAGAPSQLETFDHKPKLTELEGKPIPPSVIKGQRYAFIQPDAAVLGPRFKFKHYGECGAHLSEMAPHLGKIVDDVIHFAFLEGN